MFGKRAERDNLPLLLAHFFHYLRHQLFPHTLAFQAGINIGMFDNAEVFAGGNKNNLRHLVSLRVVNIKFVMPFQYFRLLLAYL